MEEDQFYDHDDLVRALNRLSTNLENIQPQEAPRPPMIQRVHTSQQITMHEAVLFLWSLKESFPDAQTNALVDELLNHIVFKTTGRDVPTESGEPDIIRGD